MEKKLVNLIVFFPSCERGGAAKVLINFLNYLSRTNIKIYLITSNFKSDLNNKNLKIININNNKKTLSRYKSGILASWFLFKLIKKIELDKTLVLSWQSSFFPSFIKIFKKFKLVTRVSEDPCGDFIYSDNYVISLFIFFTKFFTYNISDFIIVNAKKSFNCVNKFVINANKIRLLYNPILSKVKPFVKKKIQKFF